MNKLVDNFEDKSEAEDDFEVEVEPQQLRAEDSPASLRLTIKDLERKFFSFGERVIILFDETSDFLLPFDSHLATLTREIGSKKRSAWRGVEIELTPRVYQNKAGETKHIFGVHVLRVPPKAEEATAPTDAEPPDSSPPINSGAAINLDDEVPFFRW